MEIKEWSYEEFPEFTEDVQGVPVIHTSGNEIGVRYIHDIEYGTVDGTALHLQLLVPYTRNKPNQEYPCVVFVQGSAWLAQYVYAQLPMLARLAERGYVIACVEYRHSGIASFPAQAVDTRNAIRYLRVHAQEYQIDPDRMVVSGDSSGGHSAMFAGILQDDDSNSNRFPGVSAKVCGIMNYYGSVSVMLEDGNPSTLNHHLPDSPEGLVMGGINLRERLDLCRELSVECQITEETPLAPVLMFHGTKDRTVNAWQSVNLYRHLKSLGKDVMFYLVKGADHGGAEFWTAEILDIVESFMQKCFGR